MNYCNVHLNVPSNDVRAWVPVAPRADIARTTRDSSLEELDKKLVLTENIRENHENGDKFQAYAQKQTLSDRPARSRRPLWAGKDHRDRKFRRSETSYTCYYKI